MRVITLALPLLVPLLLLTAAHPAQADAKAYETFEGPHETYYLTSQYLVYKETNLKEGLQEGWEWRSECSCIRPPDETVYGQESFCPPHNPIALTNLCLSMARSETGLRSTFPVVTTGTEPLCAVSVYCVDRPSAAYVMVHDEIWVVAPTGYVEVTLACSTGAPCRFTLS